MTKKEIREKIDHDIMWELKFAIDDIESENTYNWYIRDCCEKIQGMLIIAESLNIISHDDWHTCMRMINSFGICYENHSNPAVSYKYW